MAESFREKMAAMGNMSDEEMGRMVEEIKAVCQNYCGECPSYTGTGETELAFCALGKSDRISEERGCMCSSCPVTAKMSLEWDYYCIKGSGREQDGLG